MTYTGVTEASSLLLLTFAIGIGAAMNSPAWGSVMAEVVPRRDLVQAIALNGVGFNLARAVGPALAGILVLAGGPGLAFALNALSYLVVIAALLRWHRRERQSPLPREHLLSAMRVGMRFVRHTPVMRAAMLRSIAFFGPAAAPWAVLPLIVRNQLNMGAGTYGLLLGLMGVGGVTAGMVLPQIRARFSRGTTVFLATATSCTGMALLAISHHWLPALLAMLLFGIGWVSASSVAQGAAQLAAPAWVRSRALAIYQLGFNGAMVAGTFFWGWIGSMFGLHVALLAAAAGGMLLAVVARRFDLDAEEEAAAAADPATPLKPEAVAPEFVAVIQEARGRVRESQQYRIDPADRDAFLSVMAEIRDARGRAGAVDWQLYEDVAHPEGWLEVWVVENWTDHLREAVRMSEADRAILARAQTFHKGETYAPSRHLAVAPHRLPILHESNHRPAA
jgi:MFS family permease